MPIKEKDVKILWGKAGGVCSMASCRKKLIETTPDLPSGYDIFGYTCHIVAENPQGPRGESLLTTEQRNRYPNLILLCKTHHEMIDQQSDEWPIEKLHQVKADHELWVETCLVRVRDASLEVYADLVMTATKSLQLEHWRYISDNAIRGLLPKDFVQGIDYFSGKVIRAIWPGSYPKLRSALENLSARAQAFLKNYMELVTPRVDGFYTEDKSWKAVKLSQEDYQRFLARSEDWTRRHTCLLSNLVHGLNLYAETVRKYVKPQYFIYEGKFAVYDDLGVSNLGTPCFYIPDRYINK